MSTRTTRNVNPKSKRVKIDQEMTGLWSWRFSVAWGYYWKLEQTCQTYNGGTYQRIFERDEPAVLFVVSHVQPTKAPELPWGKADPRSSVF